MVERRISVVLDVIRAALVQRYPSSVPIDADLREKIAALCRGAGWVRLAVLFGSRASGKARATSDFDLAVLPSRIVTLAEELSLASNVSAETRTEVDIVRLDQVEPLVGREIAVGGILLFEERRGLFSAWRARAISDWLDFDETIAPYRARFLKRVAGAR